MKLKKFKKLKRLSYTELGKLFSISRSRVYDLCHNRKGSIRMNEVNSILKNSSGCVTPEDLGLEVTDAS